MDDMRTVSRVTNEVKKVRSLRSLTNEDRVEWWASTTEWGFRKEKKGEWPNRVRERVVPFSHFSEDFLWELTVEDVQTINITVCAKPRSRYVLANTWCGWFLLKQVREQCMLCE